MKFWYEVLESRCIDVDFQEIYDYIKSDDPDIKISEVYYTFTDNVAFYLSSMYGCEDLEEYNNEYNINELIDFWGNWFDKMFGENWDGNTISNS